MTIPTRTTRPFDTAALVRLGILTVPLAGGVLTLAAGLWIARAAWRPRH